MSYRKTHLFEYKTAPHSCAITTDSSNPPSAKILRFHYSSVNVFIFMEYFLQISHQTYVYLSCNMSPSLGTRWPHTICQLECWHIATHHFPHIQYVFPGCILNHAWLDLNFLALCLSKWNWHTGDTDVLFVLPLTRMQLHLRKWQLLRDTVWKIAVMRSWKNRGKTKGYALT